MTLELDERLDELILACNLRSDSSVLVIGAGTFPDVKRYVRSVRVAKKSGDINKLLATEPPQAFDRVIVLKENEITGPFIDKVSQLVAKDGLLLFAYDDPMMRDMIVEHVGNNHPNAGLWDLDAGYGSVIITDARGLPASIWSTVH